MITHQASNRSNRLAYGERCTPSSLSSSFRCSLATRKLFEASCVQVGKGLVLWSGQEKVVLVLQLCINQHKLTLQHLPVRGLYRYLGHLWEIFVWWFALKLTPVCKWQSWSSWVTRLDSSLCQTNKHRFLIFVFHDASNLLIYTSQIFTTLFFSLDRPGIPWFRISIRVTWQTRAPILLQRTLAVVLHVKSDQNGVWYLSG